LPIVLAITASCDLANQAQQLLTLTRCQYKLDNVSNIGLAGVPMDGKSLGAGLGIRDLATLGFAYVSGNFPLSMNVNINILNDQKDTAALTQLDYIMSLEGTKLTEGSLPKRFKVVPGTTGTLSIPVSVNMLTAFSGKTQTDLINLVLALAGQSSSPANLGLRIRPYFTVNGQTVKFPNYFTVTTAFKRDSI